MSHLVTSLEIVPTLVFPLPGGGNPGPVVLGGDALDVGDMRAVAARLGAEVAFVLPATRPDCEVRLRFFVPEAELQMCVHATIAATTVLVARGVLAPARSSGSLFESPLGPLVVSWSPTDCGLAVTVEQLSPALGPVMDPDGLEVALALEALRLDHDSLDLDAGPLQVASVSRSKLMVPVRDAATLDAVRPDWDALWRLCDMLHVTGIYPFTRRPRDPHGSDVDARQFPVRAGFVEDPATGVAAAALAAYLEQAGTFPDAPVVDGWRRLRIAQGHAMGRPCLLEAQLRHANGGAIRTRVRGYADQLETVSWSPL